MENMLEKEIVALGSDLINNLDLSFEEDLVFTIKNASKITKGPGGQELEAWRPTVEDF